MSRGLPDYEVLSGGGDILPASTDPEALKALVRSVTGRSPVLETMQELIREELRKGSYQMPGELLPYETQARAIAARLIAAGYKNGTR